MKDWQPAGPDRHVPKVKKLLIPVPADAKTKTNLCEYNSDQIERVSNAVIEDNFKFEVNRAGKSKRTFRVMVYKIKTAEKTDQVCVILGSTPS